jgi:predicted metal-dependent hydrolase
MESKIASNSEWGLPSQQRLREGIALFNRGEFFECHEILEAAWMEAADEEKIFLQGLIQVAVSFYHLRRGNFPGSHRLLRAGLEKLSGCATRPLPGNFEELLQILKPLPDQIEAGQIIPEFPAPKIEWPSSA